MYIFRKAESSHDYEELFKLRYKVYCLEKHWLHQANYPTAAETDVYDPYAIHFVAEHPEDGIVGTIRLIPYRHSLCGLPIQHHPHLLTWLPYHEGAELSRFAIDKRMKDDGIKLGEQSKKITLGLVRILYQYSKAIGIQTIYIVSEWIFIRLMNIWGFCFVPIAPEASYVGGTCTPASLEIQEFEARLQQKNFPMYLWLQEQSAMSYEDIFLGKRRR